ncbi:MAG: hypothetical protein IPM82_21300 [Saprospiraceae bacterium]|nr:hypothetical protein [Saprospiraceae bacterium]
MLQKSLHCSLQNPVPTIGGNLVADYPFSGNAKDATAYHNDATASGAQLTTDRFGKNNKAYAFNGTSDEVEAANSPQQNSANTTIGLRKTWQNCPPAARRTSSRTAAWQERWKISCPSHGKTVFTTTLAALP